MPPSRIQSTITFQIGWHTTELLQNYPKYKVLKQCTYEKNTEPSSLLWFIITTNHNVKEAYFLYSEHDTTFPSLCFWYSCLSYWEHTTCDPPPHTCYCHVVWQGQHIYHTASFSMCKYVPLKIQVSTSMYPSWKIQIHMLLKCKIGSSRNVMPEKASIILFKNVCESVLMAREIIQG